MSRRPAAITQADVARAIRAAKAEGWRGIRLVLPKGAVIEITEQPVTAPEQPVEQKRTVVL